MGLGGLLANLQLQSLAHCVFLMFGTRSWLEPMLLLEKRGRIGGKVVMIETGGD